MQLFADTEFSYHGISFDERMAIFRLFHDDDNSEESDQEPLNSI